MIAIIGAKPFNSMIRSLKKTVDPRSPRTPCRKIHIRLFESAPGVWCFRATASDCFRVSEDTAKVLEVVHEDDIRTAEINPPRLAAKGPVRIELLPEKTVVSFDDVSFTTMRDVPPDQPSIDAAPAGKPDPFEAFMLDVKTKTAAKPGRISVSCSPKFLLEAAEAMKGSADVRIDLGSPVDPIILTGRSEDLTVIRAILPRRSSQGDTGYREQLAKTVVPDAAR